MRESYITMCICGSLRIIVFQRQSSSIAVGHYKVSDSCSLPTQHILCAPAVYCIGIVVFVIIFYTDLFVQL